MIIVKVELHSGGKGGPVTQLGEMHITNDVKTTTSNPRLGSYKGKLLRKGSWRTSFKEGRVDNYRRLDNNVWVLVKKMLEDMYGKKGQ